MAESEQQVVNFYSSETDEQRNFKKLRYQQEKLTEQSEKYLNKVSEIYRPNQILIKKSRAQSMKKNDQLTAGTKIYNQNRQPGQLTGNRNNRVYVRNMSSNLSSQTNPMAAKPIIAAKKPRPITSGGVSLINRAELDQGNQALRKSQAFVTATNGFYPAVKMNSEFR